MTGDIKIYLTYTQNRLPAWGAAALPVARWSRKMPEMHTDPNLLAALRKAAGQKMTPDQVREQRISFVMSAIEEGSDVSRAEVGRMIDEREGEAA